MKKWSVLPIAMAGTVMLAGCSESPEKNLTDEQIKEFEVEKELNKISGVLDENFEETENIKEFYANRTSMAEKILSGKVSINGQKLGIDSVFFGYDSEWGYAVEKLIKMDYMKESLKEKDIKKMKEMIKEKYYPNNKEVADYVLEENAIYALYYKKQNKVKEQDIIEYYEKYYIEDVYKGLINLPRYEDDKELYEIYYLLDGVDKINEELKIEDIIKNAKFGENYEWLKRNALGEEVSEVSSQRELKDIVFSYGEDKYTVKDIGEIVFAENYLYEYEKMKAQQKYSVLIEDVGYNLEAFSESLKLLGIDYVYEEDLMRVVSYITFINQDKLIDEEGFEDFYAKKVEQLEFDETISGNQYVKDYYKLDYFIENANEELVKKIEDKVDAIEVDEDKSVINEDIEKIYQAYKESITKG